jgi:hypothetical protein
LPKNHILNYRLACCLYDCLANHIDDISEINYDFRENMDLLSAEKYILVAVEGFPDFMIISIKEDTNAIKRIIATLNNLINS